MEISIIISSFKEQNIQLIKQCLNAVYNQTFRDFEVIFSEDGHGPETEKLLSSYDNITYLPRNKDYCVSRSRNSGAEIANGQYLIFLDADTCLSQNALKEYSLHFENADVIFGGIDFRTLTATGLLPDPDYTDFRHTIKITGKTIYYKNEAIFEKINQNTDLTFYQLARLYCWGANFGIKKDLFYQLGGFEEEFTGWGLEDVEFGCRIFLTGNISYRYIKDAGAVHIREKNRGKLLYYSETNYYRNKEILNKAIRRILTRPEGFEPPTF